MAPVLVTDSSAFLGFHQRFIETFVIAVIFLRIYLELL